MKAFLFILLLSMGFIYSYGQDDNKEGYILTTDGQKIVIVPGEEDLDFEGGSKLRYCTSKVFKRDYYVKNDEKKEVLLKVYTEKYETIKTEDIEKVVDGDYIYLPFYDKKGQFKKVCRDILINDNYILGFYKDRVPDGLKHRFVILDKKTRYLVDKADMYFFHKWKEKQPNTYKEFTTTIRKYFGDCFDEENLMVYKDKDYYIKYLEVKGKKSPESGEDKFKDWYQFIRGTFTTSNISPYDQLVLPKYNRFECK